MSAWSIQFFGTGIAPAVGSDAVVVREGIPRQLPAAVITACARLTAARSMPHTNALTCPRSNVAKSDGPGALNLATRPKPRPHPRRQTGLALNPFVR